MRRLLWQLPIGSGVIDCALSRSTSAVIAGDVNGEVVVVDYEGKEVARYSYSMPVWGIDINENGDTFAVGLADKPKSRGGLIIARHGKSILERELSAPVWDVKFLGNDDKVIASTWAGVYEFQHADAPLAEMLEGKSVFGISIGEDGRVYLTVSGEGLCATDSSGKCDFISRSRVACYNNVCVKGQVFYGSSSNLLSVAMIDGKSEKHYQTALNSPCAIEIFGEYLLIGDLVGNFIVSRSDSPHIPQFHQRFEGGIWNISADPEESLVFIACGDGFLRCYDFDEKNLSPRVSAFPETVEWIKTVLAGTKVFISYAREDETVVRSLCESLIAVGCEPWVDFRSLLPGQNWKREITNAIKRAEFFIVCLSKHSSSKTGFVQREIREALEMLQLIPEGKIFLIPMRLDDCEIPDSLAEHHCVSLFAEDGMAKLLQAMCFQKTAK